MAERKRVCCNCEHNIRREVTGLGKPFITCDCELDGHYIGYVECMTGWCRHWKKERKWEGKDDGKIH